MDKKNAFLLAMYYTGWFASDIGASERVRFVNAMGGYGKIASQVEEWIDELFEWFDGGDITAADVRDWIKSYINLILEDVEPADTIMGETHGQA